MTEYLEQKGKIIFRKIAIEPQYLGLKDTESYEVGDILTYNGTAILITSNGISPMHQSNGEALYLVSGCKVTPCCNQYIDNRKFSWKEGELGEKVVLCHYFLRVRGHASNCTCACCGYTYDFVKPKQCECEQTPPIDPGDQEMCVIC